MKKLILFEPQEQANGLKRYRLFMLFCAAVLAGIVCGSFSSRGADAGMLQSLDVIFRTNYALRSDCGIISTFISSFSSGTIFMLVIFLLGISLWGWLLCLPAAFFKGYGYGLSAGFIYGAYGMKGIFYNLLVILPGMFISSAVIAAASLYSFRNSINSVMFLFRSPIKDDPQAQFRAYAVTMLKLMLLCAASSLADMLCALCFSWMFSF